MLYKRRNFFFKRLRICDILYTLFKRFDLTKQKRSISDEGKNDVKTFHMTSRLKVVRQFY